MDNIMFPVEIDGMEGHCFEYFCADLLSKNGFRNVEVTQGSGDYGVDILAKKHGKKYAIQVKNYSSHVGNKAVQEAYSGMAFYHCDKSAVITNNYFTQAAKTTANEIGVELWDRRIMEELIIEAYPYSFMMERAKKKSIKKNNNVKKKRKHKRSKKRDAVLLFMFLALVYVYFFQNSFLENVLSKIAEICNNIIPIFVQ